ncbi:MAG: SufD family Fe-S cluster assembly protein, partial [Verrucomicrobia bacterium]|nr:SufD family Fe-S cluster assembly protein [Verrucomicrobiota bacterium]
ASHGCTTGQLNEEELFYLRSRGLSLPSAREWLIAGFCKEITDHAR